MKVLLSILLVASSAFAQGRLVRANGVNAQTGTTYTYLTGDYGKLVTHSNGSAIAATLPQANSSTFHSGWIVDVQNLGAGTLTITPTTSTINGAATLVLTTGQGAHIVSNGANYSAQLGKGGSSSGDALVANPLSQFAPTTSAQLRTVLSDESGIGNAYFQGGDAGTPSGIVLTNGTGYLWSALASPPFIKNAQTSTYQVLAADFDQCKTITVASGTFTVTLVASGSQPADGKCLQVINYGSGVVTVARSGQNINGAAANLTLAAGSASAPTGVRVFSDGTNYFAQPTVSAGSGTPGGSTTQLQYNNAGAFGGITGATTDGTTVTLVGPILGTPASGNAANLTGYPWSSLASRPFIKNAQTTTYQVLAADFDQCKTITVASGTFTITLVASGSQPADGKCLNILNYGSGVVTVARSGQNINGAAANLTMAAGSASAPTGLRVISDATNYFAQPFITGSASGVSSIDSATGAILLGAGLSRASQTISFDSAVLSGVYLANAGSNAILAGTGNTCTPSVTTECFRLVGSVRPTNPGAGALNLSLSGAFEFYTGTAWMSSFVRGTPASAGASCVINDLQFDASFAYFCIATNTWKRVAIATW